MIKYLLALIAVSQLIYGQELGKIKLCGLLYEDSRISFEEARVALDSTGNILMPTRKSPFLAAAMSAVIPGAGEFYNGDYIKTAIFVAIEATAITVGLIYNKKGDDQTNIFETYAKENWSVKKYAQWTVDNAQLISDDPSLNPSDFHVFDSKGNVVWSELNRLESAIGMFYSHRLAYYGEQQYYEMIGKYEQFYQGWDDADQALISYDQIKARLDAGGTHFIYYSKERGKANDFYNVASKAVIVVVTNHIISAIDAAWSASRINKKLNVSAKLKKFDIGYSTIYYPQLNLQYNF